MRHDLKTWPEYYSLVESGQKKFEIRKNDRHFQEGDTLILKEWDAINGYSGAECRFTVDYVFRGPEKMGVKDGFVIMSITRF